MKFLTEKNRAVAQREPDDKMEAIQAIHEQLIRMDMNKEVPSDPVDPSMFVDVFDDTSGTILTLNKDFDRPVLITSILVSIPSASTGTLTIGRRLIPLQSGLANLNSISMIIFPSDTVTLTSSNAGNLYLEIMGKSLRRDDWRVIS